LIVEGAPTATAVLRHVEEVTADMAIAGVCQAWLYKVVYAMP
jgi:hypothetical protein